MDFTFVDTYIQKTWVLSSACLMFWPTTAIWNEQTEKHPRGSILYTVKCASEDMVSPRSTLRRVYATPRGVTSAMFLIPIRLW